MRKYFYTSTLILALVFALAGTANADLALTATKSGANIDVNKAGVGSTFNPGGNSEWAGTLVVTCNWACTAADVAVTDGGAPVAPVVTPTPAGNATLTYAIAPLGAGVTSKKLDVTAGGKRLTTTLVPSIPAADEAPPSQIPAADEAPPKTPTVDLASLVGRECALPASIEVPASYDRKNNAAHVVVTPNGVLLSQMPTNIDENDSIQVQVFADPRLLSHLKVRRTSNIRQVQSLRIVGSDAQFTATDWVKHSKGKAAAELPPCESRSFFVGDFSPGRAEITISLSDGKRDSVLGSFEFVVNPLYSGIFSFGAIWTTAQSHDFSILATTSQITDTEFGKRRLDYVLFYTPYVWGKRDIERSVAWYERINPTVAVALEDLTDNGIAGISVDFLNGFVFTAGVHVRRITILDPESGLSVGSPFDGTADELPVAHKWETGSFWGVSVDLRAAVQIVRTLLGTATQSKS